MFEKEFDFYKQNLNEFLKNNENDFVVIEKNEIIGFYKTLEEALTMAKMNNLIGKCFIKECLPKEKGIHRYYSRVSLHV